MQLNINRSYRFMMWYYWSWFVCLSAQCFNPHRLSVCQSISLSVCLFLFATFLMATNQITYGETLSSMNSQTFLDSGDLEFEELLNGPRVTSNGVLVI